MFTRCKQPKGVQQQRLSEGTPWNGMVRQSGLAVNELQEVGGNDQPHHWMGNSSMCAQAAYTARYTGRLGIQCALLGSNA